MSIWVLTNCPLTFHPRSASSSNETWRQTVNPNDVPSSVEKYETSWGDVLEYRTNDLCGQVVGMCGCVDREVCAETTDKPNLVQPGQQRAIENEGNQRATTETGRLLVPH